jgi:hypothetical protein
MAIFQLGERDQPWGERRRSIGMAEQLIKRQCCVLAIECVFRCKGPLMDHPNTAVPVGTELERPNWDSATIHYLS